MWLLGFRLNMLVSQPRPSKGVGRNGWGLAVCGISLRWHQWDPACERGRVGGVVGGMDNMGGTRKGWYNLTERRAWRTSRDHTTEYQGKNRFCHTLSWVNTVWITNTHNSTPHLVSPPTSAPGLLIRYCLSSIAASENPPLDIFLIVMARRMSDCSSCTRPPCLAIVADTSKTCKRIVAAST